MCIVIAMLLLKWGTLSAPTSMLVLNSAGCAAMPMLNLGYAIDLDGDADTEWGHGRANEKTSESN